MDTIGHRIDCCPVSVRTEQGGGRTDREVHSLEEGWNEEAMVRASGISAKRSDVATKHLFPQNMRSITIITYSTSVYHTDHPLLRYVIASVFCPPDYADLVIRCCISAFGGPPSGCMYPA